MDPIYKAANPYGKKKKRYQSEDEGEAEDEDEDEGADAGAVSGQSGGAVVDKGWRKLLPDIPLRETSSDAEQAAAQVRGTRTAL